MTKNEKRRIKSAIDVFTSALSCQDSTGANTSKALEASIAALKWVLFIAEKENE